MAGRWTNDHFRFDIMLGLMKARVRGVRRWLTEHERERVAQTIVEHLRLSRWRWWRETNEVGPGYLTRAAEDDHCARPPRQPEVAHDPANVLSHLDRPFIHAFARPFSRPS